MAISKRTLTIYPSMSAAKVLEAISRAEHDEGRDFIEVEGCMSREAETALELEWIVVCRNAGVAPTEH